MERIPVPSGSPYGCQLTEVVQLIAREPAIGLQHVAAIWNDRWRRSSWPTFSVMAVRGFDHPCFRNSIGVHFMAAPDHVFDPVARPDLRDG